MLLLLLLLLFTFSGFLLAVLSIPLILRKIRPNSWYGFQVRKTSMTLPCGIRSTPTQRSVSWRWV
jgi:hypothetical protein